MSKRVEAAKLFTQAMHDESMQDRWIVDEEWVRHIRLYYSEQVWIHDMNMGLSKICMPCNDQCLLDNYTLLHNVKSIKQQNKKVSRTCFYYVVSLLDKLVPTISSNQTF